MITFPSPFSPLRSTLGLFALLAALALPSALLAAQTPPAGTPPTQEDKDKKQLSEKVREGITKFGPLQDAKDWAGAIALFDELQKSAAPDSYDEYIIASIKGQLYITMDQPTKALQPLETTVRLADRHNYWIDGKEERKFLKFLAQGYYGEASAKDVTPAKQQEFFGKAADYLKRIIDSERADQALNADDFLFYAYVLYNRSQLTAGSADPVFLKQAQQLSEEGLTLTLTPKVEFYKLLISTLLAQNEYVSAAELIELQLKKDPTNKDYWTQLSALYSAIGLENKDDKQKALEQNVRAILTYERAQAAGQLKTPKDNFNLVATYANIGQVEHAAQLLEAGLKNGSIEADQQKWTYLVTWHQMLNHEMKSIEVLKEAAKHFPNSGEFDLMAAQSYYGLEKFEEALQQAKLATAKGLGDKTWQAWSFAAYTAYELQKYDEALEALNKAMGYPDSKRDSQLPVFKESLEKLIADRNLQAEALKARQQE